MSSSNVNQLRSSDEAGAAEKLDLNRCRPYLRLLAATGLNYRLRAKIDPSDIVQLTLLQAHQAKDAFRGSTGNELLGWLKQILTRNLIKAVRDYGREKRDINREQSMEATLQNSWLNVDHVLAQNGTAPLDKMQYNEERIRMCAAVEQLPDSQRLAVELHHFLGWPISQVAEEMEKTPVAIAGLLKRGLKALRSKLKSGVDLS